MMAFIAHDEMRYYQFPSFDGCGIKHGIFTRHGGVSPHPWQSLNLGGMVGDQRENIVENRRRCFEALDQKVETLFDVWQVHSADVIFADRPRPLESAHQKADIILTDRLNLTLMMRFADCVPILLVDPIRKVIGIAHAGWQGTIKKVAAGAVEGMQTRYGCKVENILTGIGPSISVARYPVGEEVAQQVRQTFGSDASAILLPQGNQVHVDLWEANRITLLNAGVKNIEISGICTASNPQDWYSHRADRGKTGRFAAIITLNDS